MARVIVTNGKVMDEDKSVFLHNGDLVIVNGVQVLMVSSWISCREDGGKPPQGYCSMIDLSTGSKAFSEPASRKTTMGRVLSHLHNIINYNNPLQLQDFYIVKKDAYDLNISLHK